MRIFLAGASGVIGRNLIPRLVSAGHEVVGMTGDAARSGLVRSLGARPVIVDVFDRDGLRAAVRAASPDAVIDQLTSLHGGDYAATNRVRTEGTRNLIDAAKLAGTPTVVAQSYCIYPPGPGLADESDPLDVNSPVFGAAAAALVELEDMVSGVRHGVLLRYGTLYGPGTGYAKDGPIAAQVRRGELPASEDVTSFVHVDDAAQAALQALGWPAGPVNIVDDEPAAATDWLPAYAAAIGAPHHPRSLEPAAGCGGQRTREPGRNSDGSRFTPAGGTASRPRSGSPHILAAANATPIDPKYGPVTIERGEHIGANEPRR